MMVTLKLNRGIALEDSDQRRLMGIPNEFINTLRRPSIYFFHIPKTGGTSLRAFLADQYLDSERCPAENWESLAFLPASIVSNYKLFYGHLSANLKDYLPSSTRTVTFLRDPITRTISTIRHLIRDPAFHPMHLQVKGQSLRQVIYNNEVVQLLNNSQTKLLSFDVPIENVLEYVRRQQAANRFIDLGELEWTSSPNKALAALRSYDFVGVMERFEDSLLSMCEKFGFVPPEMMPELNRASDSVNLDLEPDESDLDHLRSILSDDIHIYNAVREKFFAPSSRSEIFARLLSGGVLTQISPPFELNLGRPFVGSGWYDPEPQGDGISRWSGPTTKAQVYLPLKRVNKCTLRITILKPDFVGRVSVSIEGEQGLIARIFRDGTVLTFELDLPPLTDAFCPLITTVVIDTERVSLPAERNDSDLRALGILLTSLKII